MEEDQARTCYETLQVHPAAPLDLVTACYWRLADRAQRLRPADEGAGVAIHRLTWAYQILADPAKRAAYDRSIRLAPQPSVPRLPLARRSSFAFRLPFKRRQTRSATPDHAVDYYEVLRLHPGAEPSLVAVAYDVMRDYYLRLVRAGYGPPTLIDVLEEARAVLSDSELRQQHDSKRRYRPPEAALAAPGATSTSGLLDVAAPPPVEAMERPAEEAPSAAPPPAEPIEPGEQPAPRSLREVLDGAWRGLIRVWRWAAPRLARAGRWGLSVLRRLSRQAADLGQRALAAMFDGVSQRLSTARWQHSDTGEPGVGEEAILARLSLAAEAVPPSAPGAAGDPAGRLEIAGGPRAPLTLAVNGRPVTLGSAAACEMRLSGLAPYQARLWYRENRLVVCALVDRPPTLVNGREVTWAMLEAGDFLTIGPHVMKLQPPEEARG